MMMHCHCSRCRKYHGSAFATFVGAPESGFAWMSERIQFNGSADEHAAVFCGTCGSSCLRRSRRRSTLVPAERWPVIWASNPLCISSP
jgi:hypothetical protein